MDPAHAAEKRHSSLKGPVHRISHRSHPERGQRDCSSGWTTVIKGELSGMAVGRGLKRHQQMSPGRVPLPCLPQMHSLPYNGPASGKSPFLSTPGDGEISGRLQLRPMMQPSLSSCQRPGQAPTALPRGKDQCGGLEGRARSPVGLSTASMLCGALPPHSQILACVSQVYPAALILKTP